MLYASHDVGLLAGHPWFTLPPHVRDLIQFIGTSKNALGVYGTIPHVANVVANAHAHVCV